MQEFKHEKLLSRNGHRNDLQNIDKKEGHPIDPQIHGTCNLGNGMSCDYPTT